MSEPFDNELADVSQRAAAALTATIMAATQVADTLLEAYAIRMRRHAEVDAEAARRARDELHSHRQAAVEVMRRVERDSWWRQAKPTEIARVWTEAVTWRELEPRAVETLRVMKLKLADIGVVIDERAIPAADPGNVAWLREALALATAESTTEPSLRGSANEAEAMRQGRQMPAEARARMASYLKEGWPEKAIALTDCQAWPALAWRLYQAERDGVDVGKLTRSMSTWDIRDARKPAALTSWMLDRHRLEQARTDEGLALAMEAEKLRAAERNHTANASGLQEQAENVAGPAERAAVLTAADNATGNANTAQARATEHELRAAQLVADGYPSSVELKQHAIETGRAIGQRGLAERSNTTNPRIKARQQPNRGAGQDRAR